MNLKSGEPHELTISGLTPEIRYYHRFHSRKGGAGDIGHSQEYSFITARPPGSPFTFTLQADSHLEPGTAPEVYQQSLINSLAAKPDFHIVLGDTFMTDKYEDFKDSAPQYLAQCNYFGLVGHSAPVFLVLGNQDGETVDKRGSGADSMAVWPSMMRKRYFPNPRPDDFYTGNTMPHSTAGLLADYYAREWGDALFVVLDPFWFTTGRTSEGDNWPRTLGREQHDWIKQTLEKSHSKFKFIFSNISQAVPPRRAAAVRKPQSISDGADETSMASSIRSSRSPRPPVLACEARRNTVTNPAPCCRPPACFASMRGLPRPP